MGMDEMEQFSYFPLSEFADVPLKQELDSSPMAMYPPPWLPFFDARLGPSYSSPFWSYFWCFPGFMIWYPHHTTDWVCMYNSFCFRLAHKIALKTCSSLEGWNSSSGHGLRCFFSRYPSLLHIVRLRGYVLTGNIEPMPPSPAKRRAPCPTPSSRRSKRTRSRAMCSCSIVSVRSWRESTTRNLSLVVRIRWMWICFM